MLPLMRMMRNDLSTKGCVGIELRAKPAVAAPFAAATAIVQPEGERTAAQKVRYYIIPIIRSTFARVTGVAGAARAAISPDLPPTPPQIARRLNPL